MVRLLIAVVSGVLSSVLWIGLTRLVLPLPFSVAIGIVAGLGTMILIGVVLNSSTAEDSEATSLMKGSKPAHRAHPIGQTPEIRGELPQHTGERPATRH